MMIYQSSAPFIPFAFPIATTPNRYWVLKNSYTGLRTPAQLGIGSISTFFNASGSTGIYKLHVDASETNELGSIGFMIDDTVSQAMLSGAHDVVLARPGDLVDVNQVMGDVNGLLSIANRHNLADSVWERFDGIELGMNPKQCMQAMFSILAGLLQTIGDTSKFQNFGRTKDRVIMQLRPGGNRINVTYNFD